ncbi:hypothetical protein [Flavobacterium sp.]
MITTRKIHHVNEGFTIEMVEIQTLFNGKVIASIKSEVRSL